MYGRDNFGAVFIRARCPRLSTDTPPGVLVMYPGVLVSAHIAHMNKVVSEKGKNVSFVEFTHAGSTSKCPKDPLNTNSNVDRISVSPALLSDMKIASPGLPKGTLLSPPRMCDGDQTFFEHWSVLTAVQEARHSFVMAELGAGCSLPVGAHLSNDGVFRAFMANDDFSDSVQIVGSIGDSDDNRVVGITAAIECRSRLAKPRS